MIELANRLTYQSPCNSLVWAMLRAAENVEILSKKGKGHIILTLPISLAHKIAKEMK